MSKKTHEKQLERARAKREKVHQVEKQSRNRVVAILGVIVLAVVVVGIALATRGGDDPDIAIDEGAAASQDEFAFGTESDAPSDASTTADIVDEQPEPDATTAAPAAGTIEPCDNPGEGAPEPDASASFASAPPADYASGTVIATIVTTCGTIVVEMDADMAPQTVSSFAFLADEGFYEGVPFHRVKDQFVIQGGDPTGTGSGGPGYSFDDELALAEQTVADAGTYPRGTLAMANSGANTNGSQFFIVQPEEGFSFPPQYAVFGRVLEGMDIVDRIAQGPVEGPQADLAVDPVRMISVTIS